MPKCHVDNDKNDDRADNAAAQFVGANACDEPSEKIVHVTIFLFSDVNKWCVEINSVINLCKNHTIKKLWNS